MMNKLNFVTGTSIRKQQAFYPDRMNNKGGDYFFPFL